jgi:hypothetical protein
MRFCQRQPKLETTNEDKLIQFQLNLIEQIFDGLGDIVFCVKDKAGVYESVNLAFVERVNGNDKSELIGKTASQVFSSSLAMGFEAQDKTVFESGRPIKETCLSFIDQKIHHEMPIGEGFASTYVNQHFSFGHRARVRLH